MAYKYSEVSTDSKSTEKIDPGKNDGSKMPENSGMAGWIYAGNISDGSVKNVMFTFTGGGNKLAPNIGVVVGTLDSGGGTATLYKVQTQSYAELSTMVTDEMVYGSNQTNNYYTFLPGYTNRWVYQLYHTDI